MTNLEARLEIHQKVLRILIENHSHSQDMNVKCLDLGFFWETSQAHLLAVFPG